MPAELPNSKDDVRQVKLPNSKGDWFKFVICHNAFELLDVSSSISVFSISEIENWMMNNKDWITFDIDSIDHSGITFTVLDTFSWFVGPDESSFDGFCDIFDIGLFYIKY